MNFYSTNIRYLQWKKAWIWIWCKKYTIIGKLLWKINDTHIHLVMYSYHYTSWCQQSNLSFLIMIWVSSFRNYYGRCYTVVRMKAQLIYYGGRQSRFMLVIFFCSEFFRPRSFISFLSSSLILNYKVFTTRYSRFTVELNYSDIYCL